MQPQREASRMHYFLRIQRPEVNYSAYTTITTPQDTVPKLYFNTFVRFLSLKHSCVWD